MFKKISISIVSLFMLFIMTSSSFASQVTQDHIDTQKLSKTNAHINLWPGDKIPQVTSVELYQLGYLQNGNVGIMLKVMGYGRDNTTIDGRRIFAIEQYPIVLSGNGADGFYYVYDLGDLKPGSYRFVSTFTSNEYPYTQRYYYDTLTVTE